MQAGLPPKMDGNSTSTSDAAIKRELPGHAHPRLLAGGGAVRRDPRALLDRGVPAGAEGRRASAALPGTSAEILDQELRDTISPGRITATSGSRSSRRRTALGIPTTSTIMYGHVETPRHGPRTSALLRDIQRETGGFTEFVPLSFDRTPKRRCTRKGTRARHPPRRDRRGSDQDVRRLAHHAQPLHPEPAGLVGEGGAEARADGASTPAATTSAAR